MNTLNEQRMDQVLKDDINPPMRSGWGKSGLVAGSTTQLPYESKEVY